MCVQIDAEDAEDVGVVAMVVEEVLHAQGFVVIVFPDHHDCDGTDEPGAEPVGTIEHKELT